jgi:hypothetical protein
VLSIVERVLIGGFLATSALTMGILFSTWPDSQMWNARFLPFYYLSLYLLAAVGLTLFVNVLPTFGLRTLGGTVAALGLLFAVALPLGVVPGSKLQNGQWQFAAFDAPSSFVKSWANWNYSGYQGKAAWPEYNEVVTAMANLGQERGCGRAMWEYQTEKLNSYGTPMSLMLLPLWTRGCIGSMEGLYFESSATTPYHFMNQSELSEKPSRAQRDLPYRALDVDSGVEHMQLMGVRYYMALSESAKRQADGNADLSYLFDTGPWSVYEVQDSQLVEPLRYEPAVVDLEADQTSWLEPAAEYYNDPDQWDVPLAGSGPSQWQRVTYGQTPDERPVEPVTVSNIVEHQDSISFDVDDVGTPVLVKSSYFPNWKVDGARGPYRVMPNLMVVVPTEQHVRLHYGRTGNDFIGYGLSLLGVVGVGWLLFSSPPALHRRTRSDRRRRVADDELDLSRYILTFPEHDWAVSHPLPTRITPAPRPEPLVGPPEAPTVIGEPHPPGFTDPPPPAFVDPAPPAGTDPHPDDRAHTGNGRDLFGNAAEPYGPERPLAPPVPAAPPDQPPGAPAAPIARVGPPPPPERAPGDPPEAAPDGTDTPAGGVR